MQGKINIGEYTTCTAAATPQISKELFLWMETVGFLLYVRNLCQQQQNNKFSKLSKLNTIPFNLMQADYIT
jgi:predicted secreted protein